MKKRTYDTAIFIAVLLLILGVILLFSATSLGQSAGDAAIRGNGGSMDTSRYYMIMESATLSWQLVGTVLGLTGGIGSVVFTSQKLKAEEADS